MSALRQDGRGDFYPDDSRSFAAGSGFNIEAVTQGFAPGGRDVAGDFSDRMHRLRYGGEHRIFVGREKSSAKRNPFLAGFVTGAMGHSPHRVAESLMAVLSAIGGAVLLAIGSNFIVPIGSAGGGVCDLAGIASLMVFLGLLDGE
jgi:hypothetical protein